MQYLGVVLSSTAGGRWGASLEALPPFRVVLQHPCSALPAGVLWMALKVGVKLWGFYIACENETFYASCIRTGLGRDLRLCFYPKSQKVENGMSPLYVA